MRSFVRHTSLRQQIGYVCPIDMFRFIGPLATTILVRGALRTKSAVFRPQPRQSGRRKSPPTLANPARFRIATSSPRMMTTFLSRSLRKPSLSVVGVMPRKLQISSRVMRSRNPVTRIPRSGLPRNSRDCHCVSPRHRRDSPQELEQPSGSSGLSFP